MSILITEYFKLPRTELRINIKSTIEIDSLSSLKTFVDFIADVDSGDIELLEDKPRTIARRRSTKEGNVKVQAKYIMINELSSPYVSSRRMKSSPKLIWFSVNSPPELSLLADPAWLAVLLTVLFNYKQGKKSMVAMSKDINDFISQIRGLTDDLKMRLTRNVILYVKRSPRVFRFRQSVLGPGRIMISVKMPRKSAKG